MKDDALWLEQTIIGGLFFKPERFHEIGLTYEHFQSPRNQMIWRVVELLANKGIALDAATISAEMAAIDEDIARDIAIYITQQMEMHCSGANLHVHATRLKRNARVRTAKAIANALLATADKDGDEAISNAAAGLLRLFGQERKFEFDMPEVLGQAMEWIDAMQERKGKVEASTGLMDLDRALGGWHRGDLVVVAARPAMGKTALGLNFALNAGVPFGIASAEQPAYQLGMRFMSMRTGISLQDMRSATLAEKDFRILVDGSVALHGVPVVVADKSAPTISEIVGQARKWHVERGMRVLLVDYLQRIAVPGTAQRHEEIAAIAQSLKNLARDLNITVIALAQVNRNVEARQDKRPQMGDLADSSGIEKEADQIIALYRDEVYNQDSPDKGIAELDVLKNRHGRTGVLRFSWINETLTIKDLAR